MMTQPWHEMTALQLGAGIADGSIDPVDLADHFLDRIETLDTDRTVYICPMPERARAEAGAARARAKAGQRLGPLDGVPLSWKDLFDTAGTPTTFGSALMRDRVPERDAVVLARATRAGMVCLGKTTLSEFAFSGLGINPIFGTPANAADPKVRRIPGGSSSGAAVSVARGLAPAGIGSDTGGSVRLPAALNGLVGLKTTAGVLPLDGALPLSLTFDTVGPLTRDVADANQIFAVMNAGRPADLAGASIKGAKLLAPTTIVFDDLDDAVGTAVETALGRLRDAGAEIVRATVPEFQEAADVVARHGNIIAAEGYAFWREMLESRGDEVYWGIKSRFDLAKKLSAIDAETARLRIGEIARRYANRVAGYAAVVMPTAPIVAPALEPLVDDPDAYNKANMACLRNTRFGNLMGTCGVTLPCQPAGSLPVGLSLVALPRREGAVLRLAKAAEDVLRAR